MNTEELVLQLLLQLIVIIVAARLGGRLFQWLGQPIVVGEILAGVLLGPSLCGRLYPGGLGHLFAPETETAVHMIGQLGLIFLMFEVGLEFDFAMLRRIGTTAVGVAVVGLLLPFSIGIGIALWMHPVLAAEHSQLGFALFVATTLSITAIPILGRILMDLNLNRSAVGVLTISAAAVDDALGWILLAAVSSLVSSGVLSDPGTGPNLSLRMEGGDEALAEAAGTSSPLIRVLLQLSWLIGFVIVTFFVLRPLVISLLCRSPIKPIIPSEDDEHQGVKPPEGFVARGGVQTPVGQLSVLMLLVLATAQATNLIGVFSVFGPFVLGAVLSDQIPVRELMRRHVRTFVATFFLPVFFTFTGLRTDIGLLSTPALWWWCALITMSASVGKITGCGMVARLGGMSWRESGMVAILMNTRALMGLVAINIGRELGVIPDTVFSMLVIMAIATTIVTVPIVRLLMPTDTKLSNATNPSSAES